MIKLLKFRVLSALLGLPLLIYVVLLGQIPLLLTLLIISAIGGYEFYRVFQQKDFQPIIPLGIAFGTMISLSVTGYFMDILQVIILYFLAMFCLFIFFNKYTIMDLIITTFGSIYINLFLTTIFLIRSFPQGIYLIWFVFLSSWLTDTGAYFIGLRYGKKRLCPEVSPKKSVEGAWGGLITSVIGLAIFFAIVKNDLPQLSLSMVILISVILSIISQIGDLTASKIKRYCLVKDFGNLIPGHGGIMDRFDSIILCGPTLYVLLKLFLR